MTRATMSSPRRIPARRIPARRTPARRTPARRSIAAWIALVVALAVIALPGLAVAKSLDEYRAEGVIAERFDGYVELRAGNAPAEARQLVDQVNAKRRQIYQDRAQQQGVPPEAVAKVYAEQILQNAPAGTYFKTPNGQYVRK